MSSKKPKLLFVYDHQYPELWRDGLWAALEVLEADFEVKKFNINGQLIGESMSILSGTGLGDFVLGWGAFGSGVDRLLQEGLVADKGLCIAGNATPPTGANTYDVLFYETKWYRPQIDFHPNIHQAFGVNTQIYQPMSPSPWLWDYLGVGSLSSWKRWEKLADKDGVRLIVGEYQKGNPEESGAIADHLLKHGAGVLPMVPPETLAQLYNQARTVYIPADIYGGGERAVLEARACGAHVEIEPDNPKLKELLELERVPSHFDYAAALKKGIESVL